MMRGILLDTNVISAIMERNPPPSVSAFLAQYKRKDIFISAVSRVEIEHGIFILPEGRKKRELAAAAAEVFRVYDEQCLPFDKESAALLTTAMYQRKRAGLHYPGNEDMMIAAIALQDRLTLVTRDTGDFGGIGLQIVNPWQHPPPN